jgi:hypothetical protein
MFISIVRRATSTHSAKHASGATFVEKICNGIEKSSTSVSINASLVHISDNEALRYPLTWKNVTVYV